MCIVFQQTDFIPMVFQYNICVVSASSCYTWLLQVARLIIFNGLLLGCVVLLLFTREAGCWAVLMCGQLMLSKYSGDTTWPKQFKIEVHSHTLITWPLASEWSLSYATPQCVWMLLTSRSCDPLMFWSSSGGLCYCGAQPISEILHTHWSRDLHKASGYCHMPHHNALECN